MIRGRPYLWKIFALMFYRLKQPTANFLSLGVAYGPYGMVLAVRKPMAETFLPLHPLTVRKAGPLRSVRA
ncbi:hypothetical protein HanIR_Chr05g0244791 [Helianthus annuus]|nr:hypothetical protein HanIR_Chr05g0244791 [Helianthus annuus]